MARKEIEEMNDTRPYCFETDGEERWYEIGCIDGMEAADTEPDISALWHDWPDMPKTGEKIIGETIWDDVIVFRFDSVWFSGNFRLFRYCPWLRDNQQPPKKTCIA